MAFQTTNMVVADWSELPFDLLCRIATNHLTRVEDFVVGSCVCLSWHHAFNRVKKIWDPSGRQMPWLMLAEPKIDTTNDSNKGRRSLFNPSEAISAITISANLSSIPMLNGNNFKEWKDNVIIVLGCMDLDHALRLPKPADLIAKSTSDDKRNFEKWDRSNRMSLMIIKRSIPEAFRGGVSEDITNAKNFLTEIEKRFAKNDKAETSTLLQRLISMKYKGKGNIREYIMEMSNITSKLKVLKLELSDDLLVHLVLLSLPAQFSQFKVSYNYQKEKWTLNELISFCVQEEERLKHDRTESAHLASTSKGNGKKRKDEATPKGPVQKKQQKEKDSCFFCNRTGHVKKDCPKYHAWHAKKGLPELPKTK